ncbi:EamA family transporter [Gorillibacterium massiliense]|uniref:EamA family transporter n=1 Tax=Gorillibacterium massiliense TaxID=1280390 RepID=UPI001EE1951C|nr:EamA family transporter [Gorillibacterium massiliense]
MGYRTGIVNLTVSILLYHIPYHKKDQIETDEKGNLAMWMIYAFLSALFAGITAILAKLGIKDIDSNLATAVRTLVVVVFAWGIVFLVGSQTTVADISGKSLLFLFLSGLSTGLSWICYFKALQIGDINKVVPIDKSSTVLSMVLAIAFLQEPLTANKVLGMCAIAAGTYLMIQKKDSAQKEAPNRLWLIYALLSALFAALTSILGKVGIENVESNLGTAIRTLVVLFMAWIIVLATRKGKEIKNIEQKSWLFLVLSGLATGLSWLCYYRALQDGQASLVVPIDKLSILVTVLFAYVFFKEKLSKKSMVGLTLIVCGTLLLLIVF